jgi:hypothetical protein
LIEIKPPRRELRFDWADMPLAALDKRLWQRYFDQLSAAIGAQQLEIEIVGPHIGDQPQARRVALTGLSYDPRSDVFAVISEALEHNIRGPRRIHVDQELDTVRSLEVVDAAGDHHILTLSAPLRLPLLNP